MLTYLSLLWSSRRPSRCSCGHFSPARHSEAVNALSLSGPARDPRPFSDALGAAPPTQKLAICLPPQEWPCPSHYPYICTSSPPPFLCKSREWRRDSGGAEVSAPLPADLQLGTTAAGSLTNWASPLMNTPGTCVFMTVRVWPQLQSEHWSTATPALLARATSLLEGSTGSTK